MDKLPTIEEFISDNINRVAFPLIDDKLEDKTIEAEAIKNLLKDYGEACVKAYRDKLLQMEEKRGNHSVIGFNVINSICQETIKEIK